MDLPLVMTLMGMVLVDMILADMILAGMTEDRTFMGMAGVAITLAMRLQGR